MLSSLTDSMKSEVGVRRGSLYDSKSFETAEQGFQLVEGFLPGFKQALGDAGAVAFDSASDVKDVRSCIARSEALQFHSFVSFLQGYRDTVI